MMKREYLRSIWQTLFLFLTGVSLLLPPVTFSQNQQATAEQVVEKGTSKAELHQALLDLTNPWTVMCVAAHPDDEDGSTLTVLRRKYGVHTVTLFSTYGEGGQNAVGPELYEELGVIRAKETLAASEVQGSEPHFLGLQDFGFSKSAEETFRAWGEKEALRRMVFQIRKLRPDAIITNHDTSSGHGHHQATGRLILQAFDAAADPQQFPEQLNQVKPWQAQKLFVRSRGGVSSGAGDSQASQIIIDPNQMDPVRGETFAQQALRGLQQHASQGPWPKSLSPTGGRIARYTMVRAATGSPQLPEDAQTPVDGMQLPDEIRNRFIAPTIDNKPLAGFAGNRMEVLVALINARRMGAFTAPQEIVDLDPQRFRLMSLRLDKALATATSTSVSIKTDEEVLVPDEESQLVVTLQNIGDAEVRIRRWTSSGLPVLKQLDPAGRLLPGTETFQELTAVTPKYAPISVPSHEHLYDGRLFGSTFRVEAELEIEGAQFVVYAEKKVDVAPAVEIVSNQPLPCVETPATRLGCLNVFLTARNHLDRAFKGRLEFTTNQLGKRQSSSVDLALQPKAEERLATGPLSIPRLQQWRKREPSSAINLKLVDTESSKTITERSLPVRYVPAIAVFGLQVAYVPSFDQTLKSSLSALGVQAKELSPNDVPRTDLSLFNTIIIDNRGYLAHPELITANDKLLKFVEDGGTLIVFYHRTNEWNPDERRQRPQLAPYPIVLGNERVTEENAPVRFLQPRHRLLNFPNRITQLDFRGWIQERGLYYPREWDQQYTALFSTHDTGETPLNGGLLVARYGKGNYIYTSMVWYRQLRAGVPGGYRFFANMISYGYTGNRSKPDPSNN